MHIKKIQIIINFTKNEIKPITLNYTIYYTNKLLALDKITERLYDMGVDLNCSYEESTRTIEIITINDNGYLEQDFYGNMLHEVTHMYQYDKGMQKRADLYDKIMKIILNPKSDSLDKIIAMALYYTFPHKQDSFTHQFYGLLTDLPIDQDLNTYKKNIK